MCTVTSKTMTLRFSFRDKQDALECLQDLMQGFSDDNFYMVKE